MLVLLGLLCLMRVCWVQEIPSANTVDVARMTGRASIPFTLNHQVRGGVSKVQGDLLPVITADFRVIRGYTGIPLFFCERYTGKSGYCGVRHLNSYFLLVSIKIIFLRRYRLGQRQQCISG